MPDGTTPAPLAESFLVHTIDRIERELNRGECGEALELLAVARVRAETLEGKPPASSRPMEVVNDVASLVDHLRGIADLLTAVDVEALADGTVAKVGYAMESLLERIADRLLSAREVRS
ncbi:MAG TPA: hypothetical protein VK025_14360 [Steroidobacter sp.]|nr:hypothetical protein [Steroidobacter sp.]